MGYSRTESYTTTGTKDSLNLDPSIAPFNATVAVTVGTTGTYKLQYSLDPMTVADSAALWFDSVNIPAGSTASIVTNFMFPVSRVRLVIAAISGTITLQTLQGFTNN
jgi:hypothetical protein